MREKELDLSHISRRTAAERDYWIDQCVLEIKRLRALAPSRAESGEATVPAVLDRWEKRLGYIDGTPGEWYVDGVLYDSLARAWSATVPK